MSDPNRTGPWSADEVERFLAATVIPMRLAVNTPSGFPVVLSVWFLHEDGALHAAVHESSKVARRLRDDPRCAIEIAPDAPPYRGVRMRCVAELRRDEKGALLRRLLIRYLGSDDSRLAEWLLSRRAGELHVTLRPLKVSTWDYRGRMGERDP